jgi:hypothetical protein
MHGGGGWKEVAQLIKYIGVAQNPLFSLINVSVT